MDRFKRFLPIFTLTFGCVVLGIAVMGGIFAGALYLEGVFGLPVAIAAIILVIGGGFSALIAWLNSETAD